MNTAPKEAAIPAAMNHLKGSIEELAQSISAMIEKIQPVLQQELPTPCHPEEIPGAIAPRLHEQINICRSEIDRQRARLNDARIRVEL